MKQFLLISVYVACLLVLNHEWMSFVQSQEAVETTTSSTVRTTTQRPRRLWNTAISTTTTSTTTATSTRRTTSSTRRPSPNRNTSTPSTTTSTTTKKANNTSTESNERAYDLLKRPADVSSGSQDSENAIGTSFLNENRTNSQVISPETAENGTTTVIVPLVPPASSTWFFDKFLVKFDRYTLIMVTAFVVGLFLIALLVAVVLCICKGFGGKQAPEDVLFNPIYSNENGKKNGAALSPPNHKTSGKLDFLTMDEMAGLLGPKENIEMKPFSSPGTSSLSSVDSKAVKSPSTPERLAKNESSPIIKSASDELKQVSSVTPTKPADENEPSSSTQKYVPSYVSRYKTAAQISKEGQNSASRRSLNRKSECFDENQSTSHLNKRQSTASSVISIPGQAKIDFGQAKDGVDQLFGQLDDDRKHGRRDTMFTDSRPSLAEPNSAHVSTTDIFIKAIAERIAEKSAKTKLPRDTSNLSSDTTASSSGLNTPDKKRPIDGTKPGVISSGRSMGALNTTTATPGGVSTDPSGGVGGVGGSGMVTSVSRRSLAKSRTDSVNTLESEKSCY